MPRAAHLVSIEITKPAREAIRKYARKRGQKICAAASAVILEGVKKP